ncbi:MAG: zinc-finger domain-containing protein [Gammaproteobacteria bacterium]|nr:zinc-finger domain-containing protein [Gammaproteobacteria bacterium]
MPNPNTATQSGLAQPNLKDAIDVTKNDMPVHCPLPGSSLWNSHPQVFIAFDAKGRGKCPYCGCEYRLLD